MKILALESSCDDTCASVVEDGRRVLSNVVSSQIETHRLYGGVVPEIASRAHIDHISVVTAEALEKANLTLDEIDAIAVTSCPGLIGALLVSVNFAKGLAFSTGKPLVPVHHIKGHMAANYLAFPELEPPFLGLIVSGGHTLIVEVKDYTDYVRLGGTRDDAAGECFDKVARVIGLPYPGGVMLDKLSHEGNPKAYAFPKPVVDGEPLSFSFSGLKTAAINLIHHAEQTGEEINLKDFSASFNKNVADYLCSRLKIAIEETGYTKVALAGGVSANSALREAVTELCGKMKIDVFMPPLTYCGDNAAMIGSQGYYEYLAGTRGNMSLNARPHAAL